MDVAGPNKKNCTKDFIDAPSTNEIKKLRQKKFQTRK
jgi:hypothetical protein